MQDVNIDLSGMSKAKADILSRLNEQQQKAVIDYKGLCHITAGAGSGKTATIINRTAYMIEDGVNPSSILLFTFTKKAANEMKERVHKLIGAAAEQITVSTYHSFCAKQLRTYCTYAGLRSNFSIYDEDDKLSIIKEVIKHEYGESYNIDPDLIANVISGYKDSYLTPSEALNRLSSKSNISTEERNNKEIVINIYKNYQDKLIKNNAVDFDDLVFHMARIIENNPVVKQQLYNKYKYITADEKQDSSMVDCKFIFGLMDPTSMNLCLVGDDNQSIYSFRGARPACIQKELSKYEYKTFYLERNYRSSQNIVDAANTLIKNNPQVNDMTPFSKNAKGSKIIILNCANTVSEAYKITSCINAIMANNKIQNLSEDDEIKYSDMAVLCRSIYLSKGLENNFIRYKIPYKIISGTSFYERKEIKDVIAFLRFLINPYDIMALKRIINIPQRKLGDKSVESIVNFLVQDYKKYATISINKIFDDLEEYANTGVRFKKGLLDLITTLKSINNYIENSANNTPDNIIEYLLDTIHYKAYLESKFDDEASERWDNVLELVNIAAGHLTLEDFIESMTLNNDDTSKDEDDNKINIMTMHGSKGLEFKIVFIIAANDGIIPHKKSMKTQEGIREERRLFYVAMTRARENLVISYANFLQFGARSVPASPSRFIKEIDPKYVLNKHD